MHFPEALCQLKSNILHSTRYSFLLNGQRQGIESLSDTSMHDKLIQEEKGA